jgi:hypothetical protein
MAPRAFISFDYDHDQNTRVLFAGQGATSSPTTFTIADWSSKEPLPEREWEALIASKISRCNMVIVLVGRSMGSASGVNKEIAFANQANVPVFGVYVDGANTSSTLPVGLPSTRVVAWSWPTIANAIEQMMGEGKNA